DEKEDIEVLFRPLAEIPAMIRDGRITHSLVIAAFYRYYQEYLPAQGAGPSRDRGVWSGALGAAENRNPAFPSG
ncbi:MAG: hypothetical protein PHV00_12075, partial [Syntrophales bacterium]|nr:hypothetical protein [Syntrophales bacterium]